MIKEVIGGFQLSPQQKRLWHLLANHGLPRGAHCVIRLEGRLDRGLLQKALQRVVNQHEVLRTGFHCLPGMTLPLQVLSDAQILWHPEVELGEVASGEQSPALDALIERTNRRPFNPEEDPAVEASLIALSAEKHLLLLNVSTLLIDSKGFTNLVRELSHCYATGAAADFSSAAPIQYIVISEWLNDLLESEEVEAGKKYWKECGEKLKSADPFNLKLPFKSRSCEQQAFAPQVVSLSVAPQVASKLEMLSREYEVETFQLYIACWQLLLWRLSGQPDIVLGTAFDGRTDEELEKAVGLLCKFLPVHCHLTQSLTLGEVLEQLRQSSDDAYSWQECFTWEIMAGATRDVGGDFFPFCFDYEALSTTYRAADVTFSIEEQRIYPELFRIKLSCVQTHDAWRTDFHYDSHLFLKTDIDRLAKQFHTLLESLTEQPDALISELRILDDDEQRRILVDFNRTQAEFPTHLCVHELFEEQVEKTPDAIAVVFGRQSITYAELNARANQLAGHLRGLGVGPEVMVTLCLERSPEMVIGLLGILKAGGVYVPLDPEYPKERLAFILQDTQAAVLLTQTRLADMLPEHGAQLVYLDLWQESFVDASRENPRLETTPENLAYAIYTSGSTGAPKGVLISHQGIVNHSLGIQQRYQLTPSDRVLQFATYSFDVSLEQILPPLITGATVVLRDAAMWDTGELRQKLVDYDLTVINLPTAFWALFVQDCLNLKEPFSPRSLRLVIVGGEAMFVNQQCMWLQTAMREVRLLNAYGPTETTITATTFDCPLSCDERTSSQTVPIGHPFPNRTTYILDERGNPTPLGVVGELHLGGAGLSRGYFKRPELTAEKFVPDPFAGAPAARLYKTGDLARYLPDGEIEFIGRFDHQVKIRGFRIELGEIEAVLGRHPAIRETVVVAREDISQEKELVAYLVARQEQSLDLNDVRDFLRAQVPEYMIPTSFVMLDALPLTPSGKVERQSLPAPRRSETDETVSYVEPRTPVELKLAEIWEQVLKRPKVGIRNNFFDIGGHSLVGVQIITRINESFKTRVKIKDLFLNPTVEDLALRIEDPASAAGLKKPIALTAQPRRQYYDLSHAQRRLWFIDQLIEGDVSYIIPFGVYIRGHIDLEVYNAAWRYLVHRHSSLRTVFVKTDEGPKAVIKESIDLHSRFYDLSELDPHKAQSLIGARVEEDQLQPFSLAEGPLFRTMLFRLGNGYDYLYLNMHHVITDGWSTGILFSDFLVAYGALLEKRPVPLEPLAFDYTDYAVWEQQTEASGLWQEQEEYFLKELEKPLPSLNLPLDFPRFEVQRYKGNEVAFEIDPATYEKLLAVARAHNVTLFMVCLTAYFILLRHLTQEDDITVGFPAAGRVLKEVENIIGFFVNTLVVRIKFDGCADVEDLLKQVQEKCLHSYENQSYPFDVLVKKLNPDRQLDRSAVFSTTFALQNYPTVQKPAGVRQFDEFIIDDLVERTSKFDLSLTAFELENRLRFSFTYNAELFRAQTIQTFSAQYTKVLGQLVEAL
jgi:amino acid adenylation domain-containing protein